jgi:hypothetical protein
LWGRLLWFSFFVDDGLDWIGLGLDV